MQRYFSRSVRTSLNQLKNSQLLGAEEDYIISAVIDINSGNRDLNMCLTISDRAVAVQQLTTYGIKTPNLIKTKGRKLSSTCSNKVKVFGVRLESLPHYDTEHGSVPRFLVDACSMLLDHADKEGLFRKTASIASRKALRAKLDAGEECLSTANPYNVACLVKEFFRELPEPVLPTKLHDSFLKAQKLTSEVDRTAATLLLSCALPEGNLSVLRYVFDFLHSLSKRSAENKMDSSNLAVILTPNLLPSGEATKNMNATNELLKLQTAAIQCFIENAQDFGVLPQFLVEKVPVMLGSETSALLPPRDREERTLGRRKRLARLVTWIQSRILVIHRACTCCVSHQESTSSSDGAQEFSGGSMTDTPMTRGLQSNYYSSL